MMTPQEVHEYGYVRKAKKNDRFIVRLNSSDVLYYPEKSWESIGQGPCLVTELRDYGYYCFAIGQMVKFQQPSDDYIQTYLDRMNAIFQGIEFHSIPITNTINGDYTIIAEGPKNTVVEVFGVDDGKVKSLLTEGIDFRMGAEQNQVSLTFKPSATDLRMFDILSKPMPAMAYPDPKGLIIRVARDFKRYFPNRDYNPELVAGPCSIMAVKDQGNYSFVIAKNAPYDPVDMDDLFKHVHMNLMAEQHWLSYAIGTGTNPIIGEIGLVYQITNENTTIIEAFGYRNDARFHIPIRHLPHPLETSPLQYLSISGKGKGWELHTSRTNGALLNLDTATRFQYDIATFKSVVSSKIYSDVVERARSTGILDVRRLQNSFDVMVIRWNNNIPKLLSKWKAADIAALADTINKVNTSANQQVAGMIKKGKIKITY